MTVTSLLLDVEQLLIVVCGPCREKFERRFRSLLSRQLMSSISTNLRVPTINRVQLGGLASKARSILRKSCSGPPGRSALSISFLHQRHLV